MSEVSELEAEQKALDVKKAELEAPKIAEALTVLKNEGASLVEKLKTIGENTFDGQTKQAIFQLINQIGYVETMISRDGQRVKDILTPVLDPTVIDQTVVTPPVPE